MRKILSVRTRYEPEPESDPCGRRALVFAGLAGLAGLPGCAEGDGPPAASAGKGESPTASAKPASTPQDAVAALAAAYRAKDLDGVLAVFSADAREATRSMIAAYEARQTLDAALDEKFGREPDTKAATSVREHLLAVQDLTLFGEVDYLGPDRAGSACRKRLGPTAPRKRCCTTCWRCAKAGTGSSCPRNSKTRPRS